MSFNDDVRIDPGRASRGRKGAGVAIGGGAGLLLLIVAMVFDIPVGRPHRGRRAGYRTAVAR
jgi:hypothetical protein